MTGAVKNRCIASDIERTRQPLYAASSTGVPLRHHLIHDHPAVIDSAVWAIAGHDVPILRQKRTLLMRTLGGAD
ncbi:MAG: hypothetical protein WCP98_21145 [Actinomycetes bacterium]